MMMWEIGKIKYKKVALLTENTKNIVSKKNDTQSDHKRRENIKAVCHENRLNVNRMTSTFSNVVRNKKKNIVLFTASILKTLRMGEPHRRINGGKAHLKSFAGSKANQLNHHKIPILEEHQYDAAAIHVGINDILKGMPNNVTVDSICNDILEIALRCRNRNNSEVFISNVAYSSKVSNELILQLNNFLYKRCIEHGYSFINNGAVSKIFFLD